MEKSEIESFVNALKSAGREDYALRVEGGNRTVTHKSERGMIALTGDFALCLETQNVKAHPTGVYNLHAVPYDNIDNAKAFNLTVQETLDVLNALGGMDDEIEQFIKETGGRVYLQPGTAGLAERAKLEDGEVKPILAESIAAHVTMGTHPPVIVEVVENENDEGEDSGG